ncbi:hypothetical protein [Desulfosarcina ovata]|uniref:Uncharacterized protein n=2 Tax=Desulfosarcina ovata TaxID=83564 RepID=A0A5K8APC7_9BACT|nr:hypothetical protein [Desulfosarcina ovata]BBO86608.1 hypothetical protein DSCO28_71740 [Desulfosarcina ovata subsp. sediminis]BBO93464.1 hypothetical protein DSCOOX_66440 [Desulfosarcina ovata subsp. ovata]
MIEPAEAFWSTPDDNAGVQNPGQPIAWDGIQIVVPMTWQIHTLDRSYLKMVADDGTVFELKWRLNQKRFKIDRFLARFIKRHQRMVAGTMHPDPVPHQWQAILPGRALRTFKWTEGDHCALGVVVHCPVCHTATLMKLSGLPSKRLEAIAASVLASFQDHGKRTAASPWQPWQIFDIHARLPQTYTLAHHRLLSGSFELSFLSDQTRLRLYRWGPAAVLLEEVELRQFALDHIDPLTKGGIWSPMFDAPAWCWRTRPRIGIVSRLANPRLRGYRYQSGRIWHLSGQNRILAAVMDGRRPIDEKILEKICEQYGCDA